MTLGIQKVGQVSINVRDLQRAIAFYRDVLELQYVWQTNGMAFFTCGEVRLMLGTPEDPNFDHPSSVLYYSVDDIQAAFHVLSTRGVVFHGPSHEIGKLGDIAVWMAFFTDSEGNTVAIQSEVPAV